VIEIVPNVRWRESDREGGQVITRPAGNSRHKEICSMRKRMPTREAREERRWSSA
jgi:hypothetical protein